MITELIMFGGVIFWTLMGLAALLAVLAINRENGKLAAFWLVLALLVTALFTDAEPLAWFERNLGNILIAVPAYLAIGAVWAIIKWRFFVRKVRAWCDKWIADNPAVEGARPRTLEDMAGREFRNYSDMTIPPDPKEFPDKVARWVGYWPLGVIADVIGDGLDKLIELVGDGLSGIMRRVSANAFDGFEDNR